MGEERGGEAGVEESGEEEGEGAEVDVDQQDGGEAGRGGRGRSPGIRGYAVGSRPIYRECADRGTFYHEGAPSWTDRQ